MPKSIIYVFKNRESNSTIAKTCSGASPSPASPSCRTELVLWIFLSFAKFVKQLNLSLLQDRIKLDSIKMPKEIVSVNIERPNASTSWGFVIVGGKDQSLTIKVGKVKPYSPAEKAGLKPCDYIWQINGDEVFEKSHNQCVDAIKNSGNSLKLSVER